MLKKYAPFFIINNEEIKKYVYNDTQNLISNYQENDEITFKIKAAIVDYYYKKSTNQNFNYFEYMRGLYKLIDFELSTIGYDKIEESKVKIYKNGLETLGIKFLECFENCPNYSIDKLIDMIETGYKELKSTNVSKKVMVIAFDNLTLDEANVLEKLLIEKLREKMPH